jgi:hypothetical protein
MGSINMKKISEHIVKVSGGFRLVSKKTGKNLGTYPTKAGAEKRERQVQYFKHIHETKAMSPQEKFERGMKRGGYDIAARQKYWKDMKEKLKKQQDDYEKERGIQKEDAPVNSAGAGNIAGIGVGPKGEPGVQPKKKLKDIMKKMGINK